MLISNEKIKFIRSLHTKKGRDESGMCLVEGSKCIEMAKDFIDFTFGPQDTTEFNKLVTTETPQDIAGVAKIPKYEFDDILKNKTIIILDSIQDPGNLGAIFRLALGFDASILLINCVDPSNSKVIRSSVGSFFKVPWVEIKEFDEEKISTLNKNDFKIFRIEKTQTAKEIGTIKDEEKVALIFGNEGNGIKSNIEADSLFINHNNKLESLNVTHAVCISLFVRFDK